MNIGWPEILLILLVVLLLFGAKRLPDLARSLVPDTSGTAIKNKKTSAKIFYHG